MSEIINWTAQRVALLTELWTRSTMTASGIAAELGGITRNAVIGKVHRLGLPHRTRGGDMVPRLPRAPRPARPPRTRKPRTVAMFQPPKPPAPPPIPEPSGAHRCDLMGLTNRTCRWPTWTGNEPIGLFCGDPTADLIGRQPYCRYHTGISYTFSKGARPDFARMLRRKHRIAAISGVNTINVLTLETQLTFPKDAA